MSEVVPEGWKECRLGQVCDVVGGGTPERSKLEYWNGEVCWVSPTEITALKTRYISATKDKITELGLKNSSAKLHPVGTVLMTSRASIGFPAINTVPMATNQGFQSLRCKEHADNEFVYQWVMGNQAVLERLSSGSTFSEISSTNAKKVPIALPPKPEQQKIASILTSVDEVIEKTESQISKLQDLKKGMMQELLTKGIGHTEFKDSPIGRIPKGWEVATMRDVCAVRQGLQIPIAERHSKAGEGRHVYLTIKFINSGFNPAVAEYIENPNPRLVCDADDIILARTGATGKVVTGVGGVFHNNFFMVDYAREKVSKSYFVQYLNSPFIQTEISNRAGTTTIPDLNHGDFYSIAMLIPRMEEQVKIAKILSSVDELIFGKQMKLTSLKDAKKALMQDLLTGKVRVKVN